jgi:hypothetical protein
MKSTASNYNINHKSVTDNIENKWVGLEDKHLIISTQLDNRIYLLVHNPEGEALPAGCLGNEVWVFDAQAENGHWSRWLTPGCSLGMVEVGGQVYVTLSRAEGIFYFDPTYASDDYVLALGTAVSVRSIPWALETNTQGANRAHDAWAHLQQANLTLGNFEGTIQVGIRGRNLHGKDIEVSKLIRDDRDITEETLPTDLEDKLLIRHDMMEWYFFANSVEEEGSVLPSRGQLNLVQYRYTPVSVNVGYEYGSVETFEYGRSGLPAVDQTAFNGIPKPMLNRTRP